MSFYDYDELLALWKEREMANRPITIHADLRLSNGDLTNEDEQFVSLVLRALTLLDREVADRIMNDAVFVKARSNMMSARTIRRDTIAANRHIVLIDFEGILEQYVLRGKDTKDAKEVAVAIIRTILHEAGHIANNDADEKLQFEDFLEGDRFEGIIARELAADAKVEEWIKNLRITHGGIKE